MNKRAIKTTVVVVGSDLFQREVMSFLKKEINEEYEEIKQLKELLLKKDLDALVQASYLEVAAEDLGYKSVAELKKKLNIER